MMLGPNWDSQKAFEKCTTACKQVLDLMTEHEWANFDAKLQARRLQGNLINVQCTWVFSIKNYGAVNCYDEIFF